MRTSKSPGRQTGGSVQVATVFGIPIRIHFTFVLILIYVGFVSARQGSNVPLSILLLMLVFGCVVLHELGHALMARRFGVRTLEIVLYPIGGIARLKSMPSGRDELLVAIAGPAVNLLIVIVLLPIGELVVGLASLERGPFLITAASDLIGSLILINVVLVLFNLIPAFPMDGGRILRAALTLRMPEDRATNIAAAVGQAMAVLFGLVGLFGIPGLIPAPNPFLLLIALFVFVGAGHEAAFVQRSAAIRGRTAREAMITRFEVLAPQDNLGRAADVLLDTHQQDFPVVDGWGRVAGVLSRPTLLEGLAKKGPATAVLEVMDRQVTAVQPETRMGEILKHLQENPSKPVLVLDDSRLAGMITLENLVEFIEVIRRVRPTEQE